MELSNPLRYALPLLLVFALAEALYLLRVRRTGYDWRETGATLGVALGHRISQTLLLGGYSTLFAWLWQHRLFTVALPRPAYALALFFAVEFCYYWHHRISHESRWFWATHRVHHTPRRLYLASAARLGWTGQISGAALFYAPLIVFGFAPKAVLAMLGLNLLYQFWLHTELVPRLGRLEGWLNTPSNHRVHHASNTRYLDRNYGGVLMVFDRLFGSYQPELAEEPCRYGLVHDEPSLNPFVIALREWGDIARDLGRARSLREAAGYLFGPPDWLPKGSRTSATLRRAAFDSSLPSHNGANP